MANINYNKSHININIDIWFVLAFYTFILVIVIFNVTKYKIKSIETSPERVYNSFPKNSYIQFTH